MNYYVRFRVCADVIGQGICFSDNNKVTLFHEFGVACNVFPRYINNKGYATEFIIVHGALQDLEKALKIFNLILSNLKWYIVKQPISLKIIGNTLSADIINIQEETRRTGNNIIRDTTGIYKINGSLENYNLRDNYNIYDSELISLKDKDPTLFSKGLNLPNNVDKGLEYLLSFDLNRLNTSFLLLNTAIKELSKDKSCVDMINEYVSDKSYVLTNKKGNKKVVSAENLYSKCNDKRDFSNITKEIKYCKEFHTLVVDLYTAYINKNCITDKSFI